MTGAQQVTTIASEGIPNFGPDPPIVTTMDLQHRTGERRYRPAEHHTRVVERSFRRPFQQEGADDLPARFQRHAQQRAAPMVFGKRLVGQHHNRCPFGRRRENDRFTLINRLIHRFGQSTNHIGLGFEFSTMGHRGHAGVAALDEPETHPVADKACRQRIHQRHG